LRGPRVRARGQERVLQGDVELLGLEIEAVASELDALREAFPLGGDGLDPAEPIGRLELGREQPVDLRSGVSSPVRRGEHAGAILLRRGKGDVAEGLTEARLRFGALVFSGSIRVVQMLGVRIASAVAAGRHESDDRDHERESSNGHRGEPQPKKARATSNHFGGTVFSSATAAASGTSTMSSPCSAAIVPNRPSSTRSAAFNP